MIPDDKLYVLVITAPFGELQLSEPCTADDAAAAVVAYAVILGLVGPLDSRPPSYYYVGSDEGDIRRLKRILFVDDEFLDGDADWRLRLEVDLPLGARPYLHQCGYGPGFSRTRPEPP